VNNEQRFQQPPLNHQTVPSGVPQGVYRQEQAFPSRTTSHRNSHNLSLDQSQNLQHSPGPQPQQTSPGFEQRRGSHQPQQANPPYVQEPKKQSLRSRIAAGLSGHKDHDEPSRNPSKNGVDRRRSVRKSEGSPPENYQPPGNINPNQLQAVQWNQRLASNQHLPVSNEQDEDDVDPFLQRDDRNTPAPPPKDAQQYQQHSQQPAPQFASNPHQEQYNRPPPQLARVNTQTQGGVEQHYSPEQHSGSQQSLYQSYSPPAAQHQQNPTEYTAFNPQAVQNTGSAPLHAPQGQPPPSQQQNYYQYQQQAQQQAHQQPQQTPSPQDVAVHYQQPPQFGSQPHQGSQEFPQHSQQGRPPSQHQQVDLQHPQATRPIPQIVQQAQQQIDTQPVHQLRPPSSQQQFAPPSPIQPPPYQSHDVKSGHQPTPQGVEPPTQNITPPQQGQDSMPPSGAQQRNTLRKVNEAGGPPPGPSREGSLLQQPTGQAQGQQPPVSPGVPTFGANVVPTASQGQPYRGEKGQQPQGGEVGRATPPPRSATDMSDEELHQLIKDHEVLRAYNFVLRGQYKS
jgi:hypothetical protein